MALNQTDYYGVDTLRIAMVGMTGTGKSALGNSILAWGWLALGQIWDKIKRPFKSYPCAKSVTVNCQVEEHVVLGRKIALVDTPGFFDTSKSIEDTLKELVKCIFMIAPGPHAILLTIRIGRFTDEVIKGVQLMRKIFGEDSIKHLIIVFTGLDDLLDNDVSIEDFVEKLPDPCKDLLQKCDLRYIGVNNKFKPTSEENKEQISKLLEMVEKITKTNGGRCYTHEYFQRAQKLMEDETERLHKEQQEQENKNLDDAGQKRLKLIDTATTGSEGIKMRKDIQTSAGGGCFASDGKVRVQGQDGQVTVKPLKDIKVGDYVQSFDPQSKSIVYSPVYYIIYQDDDKRVSTLRELFYEDDFGKEHSLRIQPKHLLYSTPHQGLSTSSAADHPSSTPTMSENVKTNDIVWVIDDIGQLCPRRVTKIGEVVTNVRHPMTLNHYIIVDDVLASVHMHNEWVLRQATAPLRWLYKISPSLSDFWISKKTVQAWDYVEKYILE